MLFNVTIKPGSPSDALDRAKEEARKSGGTIKHEYTIIKGFTVEYPNDHVGVLQSDEQIFVERDGEVTAQ